MHTAKVTIKIIRQWERDKWKSAHLICGAALGDAFAGQRCDVALVTPLEAIACRSNRSAEMSVR